MVFFGLVTCSARSHSLAQTFAKHLLFCSPLSRHLASSIERDAKGNSAQEAGLTIEVAILRSHSTYRRRQIGNQGLHLRRTGSFGLLFR